MKLSPKLNQFLCKGTARLKQSSPLILTIIGAAGVIATAVTAVRATPKALKIIRDEQNWREFESADTKGLVADPLTKTEIVKLTWKCYIPSVVIGATTITCIFGAHILNRKQQAMILSAYTFLDKTFKEYKEKVKEKYGDEAAQTIETEIVKDKYRSGDFALSGENMLFYEGFYGEYFERTRGEVLDAECALNKVFAEDGFAPLNSFYQLLGIETKSIGDFVGWSYGAGSRLYGYSWIEFDHKLITLDDGMECTIIEFPTSPPTPDYLSTAFLNDAPTDMRYNID